MKFYYVVIVIVFCILAGITYSIRDEQSTFWGIADTKEIVINSESSVDIDEIKVVPGQSILRGEILVVLRDQKLEMKISDITYQLDELTSQQAARANLSKTEILQLSTEQKAHVNTLKAQIQELQSQYAINHKLVAELKSIKVENPDEKKGNENSPYFIKLQQLKAELAVALDSSRIMMNRLHSEQAYSTDPLSEKIKGLKSELQLLTEQKERLIKIAPIDGVIGTVDFKEGEKASPFAPIITIHEGSPSLIKGYIPENALSLAEIGQPVTITSFSGKLAAVKGTIVGVGSRIVEYPERMRMVPDVKMWGREVTVRIPEHNRLLLGEKVKIVLSSTVRTTNARSLPVENTTAMRIANSRVDVADTLAYDRDSNKTQVSNNSAKDKKIQCSSKKGQP